MSVLCEIRSMLQDVDYNYSNINAGGCAAVAAIIGRCLENVTEVRIASCSSWDEYGKMPVNEAREEIYANNPRPNSYDWNGMGFGFSHVWVQFIWNGMWHSVDVEQLNQGFEMEGWPPPYTEEFTVRDMKHMALDDGDGWNCMFDRDQLPAIEHDIVEGFKRIFPNQIH